MSALETLAFRDSSEAPNQPLLKKALEELWQGKGMKTLRGMLQSNNDAIVEDALYLLSELGEMGAELVPAAIPNTQHSRWQARFYLADSLLANFRVLSKEHILSIVELLADNSEAVRFKVSEILARVNINDLASSLQSDMENQRSRDLYEIVCSDIDSPAVELKPANQAQSAMLLAMCLRFNLENSDEPLALTQLHDAELSHYKWKAG